MSRPILQVKPILDRAIVLPLEGKGDRVAVDEVTCSHAPLRGASCIAARTLDRGRVLSITSAGGAKPNAGRGGLEGFTPPHRFKARTAASDGHCAFTRAARSAGLNFAVILLSKAMVIGRDHLIHRKRSPFPYEGRPLTRS